VDPVFDTTLRAALSFLFLVAAGHKLRDLGRFRATLADYRLLPASAVSLAAGLVALVEVAVAALLVTPGARSAGLGAAATLLVVYAGAVGVNLARGRRDIDCGCAGPAARRPISGWLVARNVGIAFVALAGLAPVGARTLGWIDALTVVAATSALAALHAAADRMIGLAPALARLRGAA
jgi:methylamine utilization protein MauE